MWMGKKAKMHSGEYAIVMEGEPNSVSWNSPEVTNIGGYIGAILAALLCGLANISWPPSVLVYMVFIAAINALVEKIMEKSTQQKETQYFEDLNAMKFLTYKKIGYFTKEQIQEKLAKGLTVDEVIDQNGMKCWQIKEKEEEYYVYDNADESFSIKRISNNKKYSASNIGGAYARIACSFQTIGNQGQQGNILLEDEEEKIPTIKDHIVLDIKLLTILFTGIVLFHGGIGGNKYITLVKSSELNDYPGESIGETLEDFCKDTKWSYEKKDGDIYVTFKGKCQLFENSKYVKIEICFEIIDINNKESKFQIDYIKLDGEKLDTTDTYCVVDIIFGDGSNAAALMLLDWLYN